MLFRSQIRRVQDQGQRPIPAEIVYGEITTLSREARERLERQQPATLGLASRLPGVSPADVTALLLWLEQRERRQGALAPAAVDR